VGKKMAAKCDIYVEKGSGDIYVMDKAGVMEPQAVGIRMVSGGFEPILPGEAGGEGSPTELPDIPIP
jgi:hypothetical protein